MPAFPLSKPLFSSPRPVLWSGLLLSLGVAVSFYFAAAQSIEHDTSERFSNQARNAQYSIASRINAYGDVLRGVAGFLQAGAHVDRAAFHAYVRSLDLEHRFPAIDTIDYAEYFSDEQRPAVERTWRGGGGSDGYPPFAIDPPGRRPDYTVLTLIEPGLGYRDQAGLDLATQDALAPALTRARDTGLMSSSARLISFPGQPRHSGLGLRLPLYRADAALDTTPQRRAAYLGSVGIGFSVARLVQGALDDMPWHGVRLSLCDDGDAAETRPADAACAPLFDSQAAGAGAEGPAERYSTVLPIDFNGRLWQARFSAPKATLYSRFDAYLPWLAMLTGFACSMLISMLFHTLASSRLRAIKMAKAMTKELRDSQAKLQLSRHKLRRLAAHADQIKEEERKRIAREIHDDLGQNLLVLRIDADMLASRTAQHHPRLNARARATLGQIDATIKSVRQIINDLRPTVLDLGVNAAVEWQVAQFRMRTGIVCDVIESHDDISLSDQCATALFRILQESLSNISQHAQASLVQVKLERCRDSVSMTVSDNGVGAAIDGRNKQGSFGLVGIEERISLLGGTFFIESSPGAGMRVHVSVPLAADASAYSQREEADISA